MHNRVFAITITVLSLASSQAAGQAAWQLSKTPELAIGVAEGAAENMLDRVAGGLDGIRSYRPPGGAVEGPDGFTVLDIGPDFIIGLNRDDMDVELVGLYRLKR